MIAPARRVVSVLLGSLLLLGQGGIALAADPSAPPTTSAATPPAGTTLTAEPSIITATIEPGGTATATLTLRAGVGLDIAIESQGLGQSPDDGSFGFLPDEGDLSPYTARPFIAVAPASFRLEAGESKLVKVTVSLPVDAGDGERYALLKVNGQPLAGSGNVGIGVALGVGVLVTLPQTTQTITGSIEGLNVTAATAGQPVLVSGSIENSGNAHYGAPPSRVYQVATIRDANGTNVGSARATLTGNSIIPTFRRDFELAVIPNQSLPAGTYTVDVEVGLEDGTILDTASADLVAPGGAVAGETGGPSAGALPILTIGLGMTVGLLLLILVGLVWRSRRRPVVSQ